MTEITCLNEFGDMRMACKTECVFSEIAGRLMVADISFLCSSENSGMANFKI